MLSRNIIENEREINRRIRDCDDIKTRQMWLGTHKTIKADIYYIEVAVNNITVEDSVIGKLLNRLWDMPVEEQYKYIKDNALGITDVVLLDTADLVIRGIMSGDAVLIFDGFDKAVKISSRGYPDMGVTESKLEKVLRGTKEGFSDSVKTNTALVRKRIRSSSLKVKEKIIGDVSNTTVTVVYVEGRVKDEILKEINNRLDKINPDIVADSGIIEQLTEENGISPFPQYQTTERPDKAAMELLNGRVLLLCDNTPVGLLLPTSYGDFFRTADDYYNRFEIASFARIIRFIASFIAVTFPAFYVAVTNFHPEIIPTALVMTMAHARENVPFPVVVELFIMELAFELLREAGVRIPDPMGSAIGIVGGLIVGQAAVDAGVISPMVVIVVSLTALASFAIPVEEMASAYRLLKYFLIVAAAFLGFLGVILGWILITGHLCSLKNFNIPYMMPAVAVRKSGYKDMKDYFVRFPLKYFVNGKSENNRKNCNKQSRKNNK